MLTNTKKAKEVQNNLERKWKVLPLDLACIQASNRAAQELYTCHLCETINGTILYAKVVLSQKNPDFRS